ncbi:MAG: hypothetical protein R3F55_20235 [Alphaproteobacteria bacterium]
MSVHPLLKTGLAFAILSAGTSLAHAQATVGVMDSCQAHDWQRFADAVEARDTAALQAMLADPENRLCDELMPTAEALVCAYDPLGCIQPAAGDDPDDPDQPNGQPNDQPTDNPNDGPFGDDGPFPGQRPGEPLGSENDRTDNSSPTDSGGDDGGSDDGGRDGGQGGGANGSPTGKP